MSRLVAITGATGFVGGHAARAFAKAGWNVRILCRRLPLNPLLADIVPEIVLGGLEDAESLRALVGGADAVVHAAGSVRAAESVDFYRTNAEGTARVVAAVAAAAPAARFVLISSLSAREPTLSPYAGSKRAGEIELERAGDRLDWSIVRPPAVYGPGDRELLPFFRMARAGWLAAPANGDARLSLIHAADLAAAIRATVESSTCRGMILEPDDGRVGGYRWADVAQALGQAVGHPIRLVRLPRGPVWALAAMVEAQARRSGRPAMVTRGKVREFWHPDWVARGENLRSHTSWFPQIDINKGFIELYRTLFPA